MTYVVTSNCQKCRFTDCVTVCPVDAFRADDEMLYIAPDVCIDCGACEPQCPVHAIFEDRHVPAGEERFVQINAEKADLPMINKKGTPLPTAEARKRELGF